MSTVSETSDLAIRAQFTHSLLSETQPFVLDVDVQTPSNGITVIFGPSGSGKSTFLRCCAGLEKPRSAKFNFKDQQWDELNNNLPIQKRPIGFVFQEHRLFPNLTIIKNLLFAKKRSWKPVTDAFFQACIDTFEIEQLLEKGVHELSGGERQRASIVRALLMQGDLLLMDEPLSGIDLTLKQTILSFLKGYSKRSNTPIFYVTHSIEELAQLADHVLFFENGQCIAQNHYQTALTNLDLAIRLQKSACSVIETQLIERDHAHSMMKVGFSGGHLWLSGQSDSNENRVQIYASDVSLSRKEVKESSILNHVPCTVCDIATDPNDFFTMLKLQAGNDVILCKLSRKSFSEMNIQLGERFWAQIKAVALLKS